MFQEKATQWRHKWYITTVLTGWAGTPYALCCWIIPCYVCVCVFVRLLHCFHPFFPTLSSAGQPDHSRVGAWQPDSDLPLAEMGIHLSICQSHYHGDGLAVLWWWQGSGTVLPGGSCVLIWVVKDASGQGEGGKRLCGKMWVGDVCHMNEGVFHWQ